MRRPRRRKSRVRGCATHRGGRRCTGSRGDRALSREGGSEAGEEAAAASLALVGPPPCPHPKWAHRRQTWQRKQSPSHVPRRRWPSRSRAFQGHRRLPCRMSWYFRDSSHRVASREGSSEYSDGSSSRLGSDDTSTYPGSGPSSPEVKPLHPALFFITITRWLQCSFSCVV
jgi:hypothetical protein